MKYYYALSPALIGVSMVLISQVALGLSAQEVEQIGKEITVRIVDAQNPSIAGSGVIIKRAGNTYTVLTAYHVVKAATKYQIILPDKQSYAVNNVKPLDKEGDLAVASFSSSNSYKVAKIGDSDKATRTTTVYVAGYPAKSASISNPDYFLNKGQVNANGAAQREGYNILYDNVTRKGMSGGAVLNEQGELVAIHGRADEETITEKSESKIITGLGTTIYSALRQLIAVGVDVGVRPPNINVAAAPKADDFYIKAYQKYQNKDFKGAVADLTEAIRLNPNYAQAYGNRGNARNKLKDLQGAVADYTQAIKINPNDAKAYYNRGNTRSDLKDLQGSVADYTQAIKINPNYADAYNNRGIVRNDLKDLQGAVADYNSALKINPNDADAYGNRGNARRELKDLQGAVADYTQAIKINPNLAQGYYNRGNARYELKDLQGAVADYTQAIKINPNLAQAYGNRGQVRNQLGDKQGAINDLQKAAELFQQQGNTEFYQQALERIRKIQQ